MLKFIVLLQNYWIRFQSDNDCECETIAWELDGLEYYISTYISQKISSHSWNKLTEYLPSVCL